MCSQTICSTVQPELHSRVKRFVGNPCYNPDFVQGALDTASGMKFFKCVEMLLIQLDMH